jgi:hypothetical protein
MCFISVVVTIRFNESMKSMAHFKKSRHVCRDTMLRLMSIESDLTSTHIRRTYV